MSGPSPTIRSVLRAARAQLDQARVDSPALTARVLLAQALGRRREWLAAHDDEPVDAPARAAFEQLLGRAAAHEPLAYILGRREFYDLDLRVDPRVLVPRPETELLVDLALEALRDRAAAGPAEATAQDCVDVVDVGTGSGAVAIAVARHAPGAFVIASDISTAALEVARANAEQHGVAGQVRLVPSDLLDDIPQRAAVITANLPYVTQEEIDILPPEIQAHEPRVALDGGPDGLALVRRLLAQLPAHLLPGGRAFFEIGASQGRAAVEAARRILPGAAVELKRDLAGLDRALCVRLPDHPSPSPSPSPLTLT